MLLAGYTRGKGRRITQMDYFCTQLVIRRTPRAQRPWGYPLTDGTRPPVVEPPHHLEQRPHGQGIELRPGVSLDLFEGGLPGDPIPVGPVTGHRVESVGHGDHARRQRYFLAAQPVRVSPAIEALVMVPHH